MKILITGGAGFIGSCLGKYLLDQKHDVKILDNLEYGYCDNFDDCPKLVKNFIKADIRDKDFKKYLKGIDVVYHFAGISALPECESHPTKCLDVNTTGLVNVLDACREAKVKRIIFSSTSAVYENNVSKKPHCESECVSPNLVYSASKFCAEQLCKSYADNYGIDIVICRFFNVFGAHQDFKRKYPPFTSYLVKEILGDRTPIVYNTSDVKRDYIYVDDLMVYLHLMAKAKKQYKAEIFNLASGDSYSTLEITEAIFKIFKKKVNFVKGDPKKFWDKYEDLFNKNYNLDKNRVNQEVFKHCLGSNKKLVKEFKYTPKTNLISGLKKIIAYQSNFKNQD